MTKEEKVLKLFYEYPTKHWHFEELIKEAKISNTISSPLIFPKSLNVNVSGLARWAIISIGKIKGASNCQQT